MVQHVWYILMQAWDGTPADLSCSVLLRRPGQPTVDMTHQKAVYARCYNPVSSTSPTSPVFDTYLADLGATVNGATPIGLQAT